MEDNKINAAVKSIIDGRTKEFKEKLAKLAYEKIKAQLSPEKEPLKGYPYNEETEVDEISKSTLGSYVKKAGSSMAAHGVAVGSGRNTDKSSRAMANRMKGMNRAADRLTKEEVELDEAKMSAKSKEWYDIGYEMGKNPKTYKSPPFGIGGAAMDAFRKGRKDAEAGKPKMESLDERLTIRKPNEVITIDIDYIGDASDRLQSEREHNIKIKMTGRQTANITGKKGNIVKFLQGDAYAMDDEDIEDLFPELLENMQGAVKEIEQRIKQDPRSIDAGDFKKAVDLIKKNDLKKLKSLIYGLDTDPSEYLAYTIYKNDSAMFNKMYPKAKSGEYIRSIVINHGA